jgi:Zn-dependent protease
MNPDDLMYLAILGPIFVVSIALHEFAHAAVADALGDPTPREAGRVTLNPLAHLDVFGTLMIFIAGFGWAKPVPVKTHLLLWPRLGSFLVSAAGPLTNLLLAVLALLALKYNPTMPVGSSKWFQTAVALNVTLAVLNILPLPPLDGGHLLEAVLPRRLLPAYEQFVPYGMVLLILLVMNPWWHPLSLLFGTAIHFAFSLI